MKRIFSRFRLGEKGFTLIELLVVMAILGVLAAVAVPNIGKFLHRGKTESYAAELHNIQTATNAIIIDSNAKKLDGDYFTATGDMGTITADNGTLVLSDYLIGLDGTSVKSGCTYTIDMYGKVVTQIIPP